jgi:hypothetical protein
MVADPAADVVTDIIGRPIMVDDFVVFYNNIYQVKALFPTRLQRGGLVKMLIYNGGKTATTVTKMSKDMVVLDRDQVMLWMLTKKA